MTTPLASGALTVFGITGDLAARKLLPALYHLLEDKLMPDNFVVIGTSRREVSVADLMDRLKATLEEQDHVVQLDVLSRLGKLISIHRVDMTDPASLTSLKTYLEELEDTMNVCLNRLFYLAIPPDAVESTVNALGLAGLNTGCQHHIGQSRLLLEKPFGSDLSSAKQLIECLNHSFKSDQIYRIDHYLAKETAQNVLVFRFENPLFRAHWDHTLIESITLTAAETLGIENRTDFYEQTGALRDFVQSHLMQLLALVTMEEPKVMSPSAVHSAKLDVLTAIPPLSPSQVAGETVRGQYEGYLADTGHPDSQTETYAAIRLSINNDRWRGVPIIMRTGKAMAAKTTEITITFRDPEQKSGPTNKLTIRIQPNEGIALELMAKKPGFEAEIQAVDMDFGYRRSFGDPHVHDAYERVLNDAFRGDQTLFATDAEELATWAIIQPILDGWKASDEPPLVYPRGSWGPDSHLSGATMPLSSGNSSGTKK